MSSLADLGRLPDHSYILYWVWRDNREVMRVDRVRAYSVQNACHKLTQKYVRSAEEMTDVIVMDAVRDNGPLTQRVKETPPR